MTSDDDFEKERQFWLQHIQQLDDYTFQSKETKTNNSQLHSLSVHHPADITCNDHEEREEFEKLSLSNEKLPSLDPSFATDEKITLQRRIVELAALRRSLVLRLQTLDEEKRNLRVQHTQREKAMKKELELKLSSSLSILDGRWNKANKSIQNIASLSTKYTALLKGVVPSAGSADWDALFREYQETMEKGKLLTTSGNTTEIFEQQTSAKETREIQAQSWQQKPRTASRCDPHQASGNKIFSTELDLHRICGEFQTSAVLREMRDRYEEMLRDLEHKHVKEIKNLRRLLKSQRCANDRPTSPGNIQPNQAVTETPSVHQLEKDSLLKAENTCQDLKTQSVSVESLREAYKNQLQDIKFKTTRAIDQMKSEIHRLNEENKRLKASISDPRPNLCSQSTIAPRDNCRQKVM